MIRGITEASPTRNPVKPVYAQRWIDNGKFVHAHLASPDRMPKACRSQAGQFLDIAQLLLWALE